MGDGRAPFGRSSEQDARGAGGIDGLALTIDPEYAVLDQQLDSADDAANSPEPAEPLALDTNVAVPIARVVGDTLVDSGQLEVWRRNADSAPSRAR